jgi:hypothetical protein
MDSLKVAQPARSITHYYHQRSGPRKAVSLIDTDTGYITKHAMPV